MTSATPIFIHIGGDAENLCILGHAGDDGREVLREWDHVGNDLVEAMALWLEDLAEDYPDGFQMVVPDAQRAQIAALLPSQELHSAEAVIAEQARLLGVPVPLLAEPRLMLRALRQARNLPVCPPIVFLDLDDVLTLTPAALALEENQRRLAAVRADPLLPRTLDNYPTLPDPTAVERLVGLLEVTKARVVLVSSWRRTVPMADLLRWLEDVGVGPWLHEDWRADWKLTSAKVHDIGFWLSDHPDFERGVALDNDLIWLGCERPVGVAMVHVDGGQGLQDRHVYQALMALGVPRPTAYLLTCPPAAKPGDVETVRLFGRLINRRRG